MQRSSNSRRSRRQQVVKESDVISLYYKKASAINLVVVKKIYSKEVVRRWQLIWSSAMKMTRDCDSGLLVPAGLNVRNVSFYLPLRFLAGLLLPSFYKLRMVMRERESERYATFCYLLWKRREWILHYLAQSARKMEIDNEGKRERRRGRTMASEKSGSTRRVS